MSQVSDIEWTDATWNPVRGCVKVSPGCANCYAETFAERFRGVNGHPYEQGFDLRLVPEKLDEPLRWKKPRRVFVNSMSDLFQDGVPDNYIDQVFAVMALASQHTFQILTKRPERMRAYVSGLSSRHTSDGNMQLSPRVALVSAAMVAKLTGPNDEVLVLRTISGQWPLPNVWLGVSVENQHFADERIPLLLQTPAAVRFISAEPLLGPVDQRHFFPSEGYNTIPALDWVIVGGESGPGARPFDVAWARSIIEQCRAAGVPVFVKQLGAFAFDGAQQSCDAAKCCVHGYARLKLSKKGGDMAEWPEDLRVREFPSQAMATAR